MTTHVQVLRWICVIPGAMVCGLLVAFPIHWLVLVPSDSCITIPPETLERFLQAILGPLAVVWGGAKIAPYYRFRTGIVLTVIFVIWLIVALIFAASRGIEFTGGWFQRSMTHVLQIAGFSWGLYQAHEADKKG